MNERESGFCSLASPHLEIAGTADPVDVWLMLEYPLSWKAKVLEDNQLADDTQQWLRRSIDQLRAKGLRVRPQFIRQPEYDRSSMRLILATADVCWQLEGPGYSFLQELDVVDALDYVPGNAVEIKAPLYFVCMNGQRDQCCARFGRPVYNALREKFGERVWQVSHLGGHRYAPNVLALPQGGVYGRLSEELIIDFAHAIEAGDLHFDCLRGVGWYSKGVQAAQAFAKAQNLRPLCEETNSEGHTIVRFSQANGDELTVAVGRAQEPVMALASCKDEHAKPVHPYFLLN